MDRTIKRGAVGHLELDKKVEYSCLARGTGTLTCSHAHNLSLPSTPALRQSKKVQAESPEAEVQFFLTRPPPFWYKLWKHPHFGG